MIELFDGPAAPLVYVVLVTIEVVIAPLPGALLYAPGGAIFGGFWGGLLSLMGNVLGAGVACGLARRVGRARVQRWANGKPLAEWDRRLSDAGVWVVFVLRVNPLTSSDLVSYAAGLTSVAVWKVMLGTLLGMAPLCWAQACLSERLLVAFPGLFYPLLALVGVWLVFAVVVVVRIRSGTVAA
ncbi:MAG: VTT domain-containing protein [Planctomycetes bacterium]|nr:VTT domain-containing protein [Planctomycetota bacterium]